MRAVGFLMPCDLNNDSHVSRGAASAFTGWQSRFAKAAAISLWGFQKWRRGGDLNPRARYRATRFRGELFQPLRHLSAIHGIELLRGLQVEPTLVISRAKSRGPARWRAASKQGRRPLLRGPPVSPLPFHWPRAIAEREHARANTRTIFWRQKRFAVWRRTLPPIFRW